MTEEKKIDLDVVFGKYGPEVVEAIRKEGDTPLAFRRILRRLYEPMPLDPNSAYISVMSYLERHGSKKFVHKMNWFAAAYSSNPNIARRSPSSEMQAVSDTELPLAPAPMTPGLPQAPSGPPVPNTSSGSTFPKTSSRPGFPKTSSSSPGMRAPGPGAPNSSENVPNLPPALAGIPKECVTPEAMAAAIKGQSPFGPPPLIDRRSGYDRRSGVERRRAVDVVFKNRRYGRDRRAKQDRRKQTPPKRSLGMTPDETSGHPNLRRAGWLPDSLKPKS